MESKSNKELTIIDKIVATIGIALKHTVIFCSKTIEKDYRAVRNNHELHFADDFHKKWDP